MKKLLFIIILVSSVCNGCISRDNYRIDGKWENGDGYTVYLSIKTGPDAYEKVDSAVITNGVFTFHGQSPVDRRTLLFEDKKEDILLDGQPVLVTITAVTKEIKGVQRTIITTDISGSNEQKILKEAASLEMGKGFLGFGTLLMLTQVKDNPAKVDSVYREGNRIKEEFDQKIRKFIESNTDSYAITYMIGDFVAKNYPIADVEYYYDLLTPRIKESNPGKLLKEKIQSLHSINVGGIAFDIELPTPDGTVIKLSSLRGKYVLLDFWASWCRPCLAEAPNVKEIYNKYHEKGFEIYGVSLDEKKNLWEDAIEKHGLNWLHVSSLKGWKCPVAAQYNVTGIPKMFILNPEGIVVAVDLRGKELKEKVASFFENE
ncbi:Thiol-disulfide oxidoreductase ResA [termite gut metagenome]|uniref:Thiol-disulfide oxidoreductase ResA n=1 Tax=termite gut metagenome TaxID=433724 RepID=A0A5J4S9G5_9ZZZZ